MSRQVFGAQAAQHRPEALGLPRHARGRQGAIFGLGGTYHAGGDTQAALGVWGQQLVPNVPVVLRGGRRDHRGGQGGQGELPQRCIDERTTLGVSQRELEEDRAHVQAAHPPWAAADEVSRTGQLTAVEHRDLVRSHPPRGPVAGHVLYGLGPAGDPAQPALGGVVDGPVQLAEHRGDAGGAEEGGGGVHRWSVAPGTRGRQQVLYVACGGAMLEQQAVQIGLSLAYAGMMVMVALCVVVGAVVQRRTVRDLWTAGAAASVMVVLLSAPMTVLSLVHLDVVGALSELELPQRQLEFAWWGALVGTVGSTLLWFAFRVLLVPLAVAAEPNHSPYPVLLGDRGALAGWLPGLAVGALSGALSVALFWAMGVGESQLVTDQMDLFPDVDWEDPSVLFGVTLPVMLAAAISEELVFRGVVQRWLTRWFGGRSLGAAVAIVLSTAVWTLGHAANTDHVCLKLGQIFFVGLLFGALARRWSVEASLVAHVTLNIVAVLGAFALGV